MCIRDSIYTVAVFYAAIKETIAGICPITAGSFVSPTKDFNFVAIAEFYTIAAVIDYVSHYKVLTAGFYFNAANTALYICPVQINFIIAVMTAPSLVGIILTVFKTANISPIFVNLTIQEQTGTQITFVIAGSTISITIACTDLTGDFYVVRFFLEVSNANAEAVEFVSKFSC